MGLRSGPHQLGLVSWRLFALEALMLVLVEVLQPSKSILQSELGKYPN